MYLGGVESGIKKSFFDINREFDYQIFYVKSSGFFDVNQKSFLFLLFKILFANKKPSLIISSLWWGHFIAYLLSFFNIKWVVFIHSPGFSSILDEFFINLALKKAKYFFFDSISSRKKFKKNINGRTFYIPYYFADNELSYEINLKPKYDFIWVGRNSKEKRIDLLLYFCKILEKRKYECSVCIVIAGNKIKNFESVVSKFNFVKFDFFYNKSSEELNKIYSDSQMVLCFSDYEGFSATIFEAILKGNLVAARRVGDIEHYIEKENSVFLDKTDEFSLNEFVDSIIKLLENKSAIYAKRVNAREFIKKKYKNLSYSNSFIESLKTILSE